MQVLARAGWHKPADRAAPRVLLVQLLRTPEAQRDRSVIASARVQVLDAARILDAHLEKQPYVAGDQFTWATFRSALQRTVSSTCPSSDPSSKRSKPGMRACANARRSRSGSTCR
jgi:glutathione S-transferase